MKVVFRSAAELVARAEGFLLRHEAQNGLLLGIAQALAEGLMRSDQPPLAATVERRDEVVLVALRTPPMNLIVSDGPIDAVKALAGALEEAGHVLPGVIGPTPASTVFATQWTSTRERVQQQRLFSCDAIIAPPAPGGRARLALPTDIDVLVAWTIAFNAEANNPGTDAWAREVVREIVAQKRLFVWEDGDLVSMAAARHPTPHGIRIGYVYTPRDRRRRGYAAAITAAATQAMFDAGYAFCSLYTDLANPTSNAIYRRIGYRPLADGEMWRFHASGGDGEAAARLSASA